MRSGGERAEERGGKRDEEWRGHMGAARERRSAGRGRVAQCEGSGGEVRGAAARREQQSSGKERSSAAREEERSGGEERSGAAWVRPQCRGRSQARSQKRGRRCRVSDDHFICAGDKGAATGDKGGGG